MTDLPTLDDIRDAARRLAGVARRTPVLEAPLLNEQLGYRLLVKPEVLQRTGSFKFRGAYNRVSRLSEDERRRGVVAYSSGNHAQGVAHAAALLGVAAVVVMPADAPAIKVANTRAYGAEVITYDRMKESREEIGQRLASERGLVLVKPYDDRHVIAGQGTAGLEFAEQCGELGVEPDLFLCPAGGGGLIAGVSLALRERWAALPVFACEPEGLDDTRRSLEAGRRLANDPAATSICDALMAPQPGEITFEVNRLTLAGGFAVSEAEVRAAMAAAFRHLKIVVEPGGAVALAAVLAGKTDVSGRTVGVLCSGGNVDPALFREVLADG